MEKTWKRAPALPTEGPGLVYSRNGYRVWRLGEAHGWVVWRGADFLGSARYLTDGKALAMGHELDQAWTLAGYEYRARELSDWHLRQAYSGALMRNREDQAAVYRAELARRAAVKADREAAEERACTEYTLRSFTARSGKVFNHIAAPGERVCMCGSVSGGQPGSLDDLGLVDCLACMEQYAAAILATAGRKS